MFRDGFRPLRARTVLAPVYWAPAYRAGPAFVPHVHAGPGLVHAAPQFNVARAIPRFVPQAYRRHH